MLVEGIKTIMYEVNTQNSIVKSLKRAKYRPLICHERLCNRIAPLLAHTENVAGKHYLQNLKQKTIYPLI